MNATALSPIQFKNNPKDYTVSSIWLGRNCVYLEDSSAGILINPFCQLHALNQIDLHKITCILITSLSTIWEKQIEKIAEYTDAPILYANTMDTLLCGNFRILFEEITDQNSLHCSLSILHPCGSIFYQALPLTNQESYSLLKSDIVFCNFPTDCNLKESLEFFSHSFFARKIFLIDHNKYYHTIGKQTIVSKKALKLFLDYKEQYPTIFPIHFPLYGTKIGLL